MAKAWAALRKVCGLRGSMPVSASASGRLGVTRVARGSSSVFSTSMPCSSSSAAPLVDSSTGSSTSGNFYVLERIGHGVRDAAVAQHADLDRVGADIAQRRFDLGAHQFRRHGMDGMHAIACPAPSRRSPPSGHRRRKPGRS